MKEESMNTKPAPPPKGLGPAGRRLWQRIARQWADDELTPDARELSLLEMAAEESDLLALMAAELAQVAAENGGSLTVRGSQGQPVTHGHVASCRQSRALIAQPVGHLGFDDAAGSVSSSGGSGVTAAEAGRRGAMMRHHGNPYGLTDGA
jgi:hypothetical protein